VLTALIAWLLELPLLAAIALGGIMSMSSTAIVSKLLAERLEIQTPHGRQIFGALLFQDLAVVPLLILITAFAKDADDMGMVLGLAVLKAVVVLGFLLFVGQRIMRPWFQWVAGHKSPELFTLNLLLFTLGLAFLTESAGLSLALGAFLAGMLISETEYRYQVEDDIKQFRDVLLGLFFVSIGMRLDLMQVMLNWSDVLLLVAAIVVGKVLLVGGLAMAFGSSRPTAVRTALGLAQAGEFGFLLVSFASQQAILTGALGQVTLLVISLSMLLTPLLFLGSEWMARRLRTPDAERTPDTVDEPGRVIIAGIGRFGQVVTRLVRTAGASTVVLDNDLAAIETMRRTGDDMQAKYKETSLGGLAVNRVEC
jgi:CPA2 family monovalent cation:H+ antiporter-2